MKMKKFIASAVAALAIVGFSSCGVVGNVGAVYTDVTTGQIATANKLGSKVGQSQSMGVLGLIATGDASIQTAARNAGITKISHVDVKTFSILGIYSTYTTVVYGD